MQGQLQGLLYTLDYLHDGIRQTVAWRDVEAEGYPRFLAKIREIFRNVTADSHFNEAQTESDIILPVLEALDWHDLLPQQNSSQHGREDVPDILLFPNPAAKAAANEESDSSRRFRHGVLIVESKRWLRPLDRAESNDSLDRHTPSNQILRYLSRVDIISERKIQWGVLTNGRYWRLYWQGARSRSEEFLEIDLALLLGVKGLIPDMFSPAPEKHDHYLRVFYLLFRRAAFLPMSQAIQSRTFHEISLQETRLWESRVSRHLGERVFNELFPLLARAMVAGDSTHQSPYSQVFLDEARNAALILLYRLLFLFYAEDRDLLPVRDKRYESYSLRRLRKEIAERKEENSVFSEFRTAFYDRLKNLFAAIAEGDTSLGLPAYNGGLFDDSDYPLLQRVRLSDHTLAVLIDGLSREHPAGESPRWINYRDLAVQHLGSIYERLLEWSLFETTQGRVDIRLAKFARKRSGSFYTHDALVKLVISETLQPLIQKRISLFVEKLSADHAVDAQSLAKLSAFDPASAILELKICDPAMGSGHFLVSLVDYLADQALEQIDAAANRVAERGTPWDYQSPLLTRIQEIRTQILQNAQKEKWSLDKSQLDDRHIVRRMILKRSIYGVDKNPMAVELAKLALWLHTFTVGAPLSFLDHHLRCGDTIYGERLGTAVVGLRRFGDLFRENDLRKITLAAQSMNKIGELTDVNIAEAHQSKHLMEDAKTALAPLWRLLDFWHALRWLGLAVVDTSKSKRKHPHENAFGNLLNSHYGNNLIDILSRPLPLASGQIETDERVNALLRQIQELAQRENFLHWELAFPTVWRNLEREETQPEGGFDAIVGNPPWDRIKLQEVEWFAERRGEIAIAARASDRQRLIKALRENNDPLWNEYELAAERAETGANVVRRCSEYPLLSSGDINIYALFVERASRLIAPHGVIGLLTPSGIAADKGAASFFQSIATTGRLGALFDFENRKAFFPDVDRRFKFSALIFGGEQHRFSRTKCAFYLHDVAELEQPERIIELSADDFAAVNPNTGTAPIFRTKRDADIPRRLYRQLPILGDCRTGPPKTLWPLRYCTMFHMTNDSHLFKRTDELQTEGWYPVAGNRWKRGKQEMLPLYEGKMVQAYDHRAASVIVNPENLHRPALPEAATLSQHQDTQWLPNPQFWISKQEVLGVTPMQYGIAYKSITAPTNMRTMIAALLPQSGVGNSMAMLLPENTTQNSKWIPLLLANLNAFAFDFILRQKVQGQNLNWYIIEQLPFIAPEKFGQSLGATTIRDFVRNEVLRLSYTVHDLADFARDMGYEGAPFVWDEEDRRHRMARLDALFFHLYGLSRDEANYVLETFPIVREQDEAKFGRYRTRDLILAYMNCIAAGDTETVVRV